MSSSTQYVFGSDRHHGTAKESHQGGTLISAGDLIDRGELQGEYDNEEAFKAAAETELDKISDNYEQAIIVAGNHDTTEYEMRWIESNYTASVKQLVEDNDKYENIRVVDSRLGDADERGPERIEAEKTELEHDLVLGGSHQGRTPAQDYHLGGPDSVKAMFCYEPGELEEAGSKLEKEPEDVTLGDMEMLLEEQPQDEAGETDRTETNQGIGSYVRDVLTSVPVVGETIFEPIYSKVDEIKNEYFLEEEEAGEEEESEYNLSFEKSDEHEDLEERDIKETEEYVESTVEKIEGSDNPVIFVDHGEPCTEDGDKGARSRVSREIIERADSAEYMLTGHMHGEMNKEIAGTKVRNPGQGYYAGLESFKEGKSEGYEDSEFPDDEVDRRTEDGQAPDASASGEETAAA